MAQDLNIVTLIGRTTKDIELKTTQSGKSVASFTLANSGYKDTTNFINIVAWDKSAELLAQYAQKGKQLAITGRLTTRSYEVDGNKRTATEVVVDNFQLLGAKSEERPLQQHEVLDKAKDVVPDDEDLDKPIDLSTIPFNRDRNV